MFKTKLTIANTRKHWMLGDERKLIAEIEKRGGEAYVFDEYGRHCVSIACKKSAKQEIVRTIKEFLVGTYTKSLKRQFLLSKINMPKSGTLSDEILIRTLIAFDRERDSVTVIEKLQIEEEFAIDGFFDFRLGELSERWCEIASLTNDNIILLYDENALNLLLRFLLSAVAPKSETVRILERSGKYIIKADGFPFAPERRLTAEELILELIDIAPMEIVFGNNIKDNKLKTKLNNIFDVKGVNNILCFGENI